MDNFLTVIFLGDIVGRAGRKALKTMLPELKQKYANSLVIANGENSAGGFGITFKVYKEILGCGVDIITGGNHIWDKPDVMRDRDKFQYLASPLNIMPQEDKGFSIVNIDVDGVQISVVNLSGVVFMTNDTSSPFLMFDSIYEKLEDRIILVDFHAEATSEKNAFGEYVDGRASAVFGTHTHVQTADERILTQGTFYITDCGSCCATNSVLGMSVKSSIDRFLTSEGKLSVELAGDVAINGVVVTIDVTSKKAISFERINIKSV